LVIHIYYNISKKEKNKKSKISYFFILFKRSAFKTTLILLKLIANDAKIGFNNHRAASGIQIVLYRNAQKRFCLIFLKVFFDSFKLEITFCKLHHVITISELSIAISLPVHIAIERSD
jgi:hypothetical protein